MIVKNKRTRNTCTRASVCVYVVLTWNLHFTPRAVVVNWGRKNRSERNFLYSNINSKPTPLFLSPLTFFRWGRDGKKAVECFAPADGCDDPPVVSTHRGVVHPCLRIRHIPPQTCRRKMFSLRHCENNHFHLHRGNMYGTVVWDANCCVRIGWTILRRGFKRRERKTTEGQTPTISDVMLIYQWSFYFQQRTHQCGSLSMSRFLFLSLFLADWVTL